MGVVDESTRSAVRMMAHILFLRQPATVLSDE
jgi:hypothetical protein